MALIKAVIICSNAQTEHPSEDIWKLKGIMTGGADTGRLWQQDRILLGQEAAARLWLHRGRQHVACKVGMARAWCSLPDIAFLEFIPLDQHLKNKADPGFQPQTVLYNELELGIYEFVLTNFHGGALMRYRIGDLFEVISLRDEELGSPLPQLRFYSRADDVIDLGNLVRLTEKDIWKAIEGTGVKYQDWAARKEFNSSDVTLRIHLEPKPSENVAVGDLQQKLALELSKLSSEFHSLHEILGYNPIRISSP
jgi:hypothetical protein